MVTTNTSCSIGVCGLSVATFRKANMAKAFILIETLIANRHRFTSLPGGDKAAASSEPEEVLPSPSEHHRHGVCGPCLHHCDL